MAKIAIRTGLDWDEANAVLEAGGYVDHENWTGAMRMRKRKDGKAPVYWVESDPGLSKAQRFGHQWKTTEAEQESLEWREVEFVEFVDDEAPAAPAPAPAAEAVTEADLVPDKVVAQSCTTCGKPITGTPWLTRKGVMDEACGRAYRQAEALENDTASADDQSPGSVRSAD